MGGTGNFPVGRPGDEALILGHVKSAYTPVRITTVSALFAEFGLTHADVLTIDTEGFDPAVLQGAAGILASVRFVSFEIHQDLRGTPWWTATLIGQVELLDEHGFDCFLAGRNGKLQQLTRCWTVDDEKKHHRIGFANVACVRRGDRWHHALRPSMGSVWAGQYSLFR